MNDRDLRKLNRQELMEMLLELSKENENLRAELEQTQAELQSKKITIANAGSIAEASLQLNQVFETAQKAAAQYLGNIKLLEKQKKHEMLKIRELRKKLDETDDSQGSE